MTRSLSPRPNGASEEEAVITIRPVELDEIINQIAEE